MKNPGMAAFLHPTYTLANLGLVIWSLNLFRHSDNINTTLLILVLVGMTYDNLIISIGRFIDQGALLELLNRLRFLLHNLFVPLLVVVAVKLASNAGVVWANNSNVYYGCWAIALGLITFGLMSDFVGLELVPITFAGSLRYKPKSCGLPMLPILTALLVGVIGFFIWRETNWPWMLVGTLVMFSGNALPPRIFGTLVSSAVDFIFVLTLLATQLIVY
ncbi:hypothetical protein H6G97_36750 [Nostoc flagelliforme FACHB-838]|uniref:Uncharacterized protein n=1 Tax=Nostoc flagelliforme FACHB-838 TaxID=2692904 RepID=A0ABR8DZ69_9NOSO|nr:hypothetical protein [Nostoc flagelliforme]MBD2534721.1 hypothetical protein [Nostoc flagelliforme FACHB-838]